MSGLSMAMAAAGTRGALVAGGASGFELAFKADALWVGTSIDGVEGPGGNLAATVAAVTRFRTGLEGARGYTLAGRLSLRPSVEVGLRHDGGDAETGAGMDVGGGLLLRNLARRLDREHPCAAASVREGLEETVTVLTLGLAPRLQRSLATTNAAESLISRTRHVKRNVKRWRGGQMMLRWVAAGVLEAAKGFRRLKGHADMPQLVAALRARDHRLGLGDSREAQHVA